MIGGTLIEVGLGLSGAPVLITGRIHPFDVETLLILLAVAYGVNVRGKFS